jgi:hypothetical protein
MKRIFSIVAAAALLCEGAIVSAQEPGGPSDVPYTPVLVSLVPGISFPFGYYDSSLAGGAIGNLVRDVSGAEGAGVFNISRDVRGTQGAGVFNVSRRILGFQGAGVFNIADGDVDGFQGAGVFNIADRVDGGQAAGLFNRADRVTGIQVGLVNVAGYIDGVQIGLVNIAGNGVGSIGLTYEPVDEFTYVHLQEGTPALYTVFGIGAPTGDWLRDCSGFVASIGLGSRTRCFGLDFDLDVSAEQAIGDLPFDSFEWYGNWRAWQGWSMMRPYPSVRLMAGLPLGGHFQIVGGLKADFDLDSLGGRVPEALKQGSSWRGRLFGEGFTVWPKWFFGVKI